MVKQQLRLKRRVLTEKQSKLHNFAVGERGEQRAVQFLVDQGYEIVDTNVVFGRVEIDIVARDLLQQCLVFCEVKWRQTSKFGHPTQAVHTQKLRHLIAAGKQFARSIKWKAEYRFDTISIVGREIEHFKNITWGM